MENKTDKPYSLQDAKESISKINGFNDWSYLRSKYSKDGIETTMAEAAELYASKATEELRNAFDEAVESNENLRKEMEGLIEIHHLQSQELLSEIERLKESNKQLEEWNNESKRKYETLNNHCTIIEESNKELVEALTELIKVTRDYKVGEIKEPLYLVENKTFLKAEKFIQKSEGDVNKKV